MKRFHFRLEIVLQYRRQMEEMALIDFQNALAVERNAERELNRLQDRLRNVCRIGIEEMDGQSRIQWDGFKRQLHVLIGMKQNQLMELRAETQEKRFRYLESKKETRILERLRERAWQTYQKEVEKQEQREMDDLFLMKRQDVDLSEKAI